jgi:hypothetical protein
MVPDLDSDPNPDPAIFVSDLQDINKREFFCLLLFVLKVHLHYFSIIKRQRIRKTEGINVFSLLLLDDRRIGIREAQKHLDPMDPDLDQQYWGKQMLK